MKNEDRKDVDDAGIRLAPVPMSSDRMRILPSVRQEFVLTPVLQVDEPKDERAPEPSTTADFQPKVKDVDKTWKKTLRGKNAAAGVLMFLLSAAVALPFILGAFGVALDNVPFRFSFAKYNVFGAVAQAFVISSQNGWSGGVVSSAWLGCVPDIILLAGIIGLIANLIKALVAVFGAVKPLKYTASAAVFFIASLTVLIMAVVGADALGMAKTDIVNDVFKGYAASEEFTLIVISLAYFLLTLAVSAINPVRRGY
jgi:hypothetical protein